MKVLMINGSPRKNGNTSIALEEMKRVFEAEKIDVEIVQVGNKEDVSPADVVRSLENVCLMMW